MLISLVLKNSLIGKSRRLQTCRQFSGRWDTLPKAIRSSSEDMAEQSRPTSQHPKCPSCKSLSSFPLGPTATAPLTCPRAASPGERPPLYSPFSPCSRCWGAASCQQLHPTACSSQLSETLATSTLLLLGGVRTWLKLTTSPIFVRANVRLLSYDNTRWKDSSYWDIWICSVL